MSSEKRATAPIAPLRNPYSRFVSQTSGIEVIDEKVVVKDAATFAGLIITNCLKACRTDYIECVIAFNPEQGRMSLMRNGSEQIKDVAKICNVLNVENVSKGIVAVHGALSTKPKVLRRTDANWLSVLLMRNSVAPFDLDFTQNANLKPFNVHYDLFFAADCIRRIYLSSGGTIIEINRASGDASHCMIYHRD